MVNPISYQPQQAFSGGADFSQLANLGEVYKKAQNESRLSDLGKKLADGSITYQQAAGQVADMGDINSTLKFLALSEQEKQKARETTAAANFQTTLGGLYGGGGAAKTIAAPPAVGPDPAPGLVPNAAADDEGPPTRVAAIPPTVAPPTNVVRTNPDGTIAGNLTAPREPPPTADAPPPAPVAPAAAPAPAAPGFNERFAAARPSAVSPTTAHIPALLGVLADPNLPAAQKDTAKLLLNKALDDAKVPEKIQTLTALKEQSGYPGSILDLELLLRKSQASNQNVTVSGEKKYEETINKDLAEEFVNIQKQGRASSETKGTLDLLERAIKTPGFDSGTLPALTTAVKRGLVSLGVAEKDLAAPNEFFDKLANKLVLDVAGGKLGAGFSNADRDFVSASTASRQNTPEGNLGIIDNQRKISERQRVVAQMARDYARTHKGKIDYDFYEALDKYAIENPLFPQATAPGAGSHKDIPYKVEP